FRGKVQRLLQAIARRSHHLGREIGFYDESDFPLGYLASTEECIFVMNHLMIEKLVQRGPSARSIVLTAKGWEEAEAIEKPAALREKAFVAMWFNDLVRLAYHEGIAPAIRDTGYRAIRIDFQEHSDSVIDRILAEIKESRFIVADFTGHRGG